MMIPFSRNGSRHAFTLIELLVVITIIGLLAGLAFPGVAGALKAAKKAEALAMINQLKVSLSAYQTEYARWPDVFPANDGEIRSDEVDLYQLLIGKNPTVNGVEQNPRQIAFTQFNAKALRKGKLSEANTVPPGNPSEADGFVDPWSQPYLIKADTDYDNELTVPGEGAGVVVINSDLAIWSRGPQKIWNDEVDPNKNFIRSWK
jgi:prepilin-type N-terminal cleavage/methylation domain-containing protein